MSSVPHGWSPNWRRDRPGIFCSVATLPAVDADTRPRPRVRDLEERDEALSWEAERARQLAALLS